MSVPHGFPLIAGIQLGEKDVGRIWEASFASGTDQGRLKRIGGTILTKYVYLEVRCHARNH